MRHLHSETSKSRVVVLDEGELVLEADRRVNRRRTAGERVNLQREASRSVSSAGLAEDRLPVTVLLQEGDESLEMRHHVSQERHTAVIFLSVL